jgi:hypothetical protein
MHKITCHLHVVVKGFVIPDIGGRLDAAPLYRKPVCILGSLLSPVKILFPATTPPIASQTCFLPFHDLTRGILPCRPVVVGVVSLHLVGCRGSSPEKPSWKVDRCFAHHQLLKIISPCYYMLKLKRVLNGNLKTL